MEGLTEGDVLDGRFRVLGVLGSGGFATVYDAVDEASDRRVAIKWFSGEALGDPILAARFDREMQAIAALRDPHSVRLLSYGRSDDRSGYLVLEHVPGEDLAELLEREGRLAPESVIHVARQVLAALREAHLAGIVHRDVKPQNIRVFEYAGDPYTVKLLDFGIARTVDRNAASLTQTGVLVGTPRYMSPEQLLGEPADQRSDIYGLGLTMVELLLGSDALSAGGFGGQLERLRTGYLPALPDDPAAVELSQVLAKMCAREPADRYPTANAVSKSLDRLSTRVQVPELAPIEAAPDQAPIPLERRPAAAPPPAGRSGKRWLVVASIGVIALVVVAATLVFGGVSEQDDEPVATERRPAIPSVVRLPQSESNGLQPVGEQAGPCSSEWSPATGQRENQLLSGLTVEQEWVRYVPKSYAPGEKHPVVIVLGPKQIPPGDFSVQSGFEAVAEEHRFVLLTVAPSSNPAERYSPELMEPMLKMEREDVCLDLSRLFVVGHGSGGHSALRVACELDLAAVAIGSARPSGSKFACQGETPVPALLLSPLRSPREPVDGGTECGGNPRQSLEAYEAMWKSRNHCSGEPREISEHTDGVCHGWDCETPFLHCQVDGGHPWPGTAGVVRYDGQDCDGPAHDFPAARVAGDFFSKLR